MKKRIAILGSTGSIGIQALEVIHSNRDIFSVEVLCAGSNADLLIKQALEHKPRAVVINDEKHYPYVSQTLANLPIEVRAGSKAVADIAQLPAIDMVLMAIVGYAGLVPTIKAIEAGKDIALANKETLVVAGELVTHKAKENKVNIIPVDSEHSAIFNVF